MGARIGSHPRKLNHTSKASGLIRFALLDPGDFFVCIWIKSPPRSAGPLQEQAMILHVLLLNKPPHQRDGSTNFEPHANRGASQSSLTFITSLPFLCAQGFFIRSAFASMVSVHSDKNIGTGARCPYYLVNHNPQPSNRWDLKEPRMWII